MIRLFDDQFNPLCEIDDFESLVYVRKHYGAGEFTLVLDPHACHASLFKNKDYFLVVDKDPRKSGIIRFFEQSDDEESKLEIRGFTLESVLNRRLVIPPDGQAYDVISGSAETAIKHYVGNHVTAPVDPARVFANFTMAADQNQGVPAKKYARYDELLSVISEIGEQSKMGFEVLFDLESKSLIFDVVPGEDHAVGSASPVIFSMEYTNLESQTFTVDALKEKTTAYVGGGGEETSRPVIVVGGSAVGLARIETFVNASSAEVVDLSDIGTQELVSMNLIETIAGVALDSMGPFTYGVDYSLGDEVTVVNSSNGEAVTVQIVEVKETIEEDGHEVELIFGQGRPLLSDVLKNKFKQYDKLLRR
jgi:hypothetical protein